MQLLGTYTALVTPFASTPETPVDWDSYERLLAHQLDNGVEGLVPCGTTGETPTLNEREQSEVVAKAVAAAKGRAQVIVGVGTNSTEHTLGLARAAEAAGADAVMVVVPYYNKPSQAGMLEHFATVAAAVGLPVVVYNIPGRSSADLHPDTLLRLLERAPNVVAVKEATGNVLRAQELVRRAGDRLTVLSGDDALTLPMVAVGARGVISVSSNALPREVSGATRLALSGELSAARRAHQALLPLHEAMFVEPNPAPVKALLAQLGVIASGAVRLPLVGASEEVGATLRSLLATFKGQA